MTAANELWIDIVGFEGFYRVSDSGRVASLDRPKGRGLRGHKGRELRQSGKQPYVDFMVYGERRRFMVSRLVATHFIRPLTSEDHVFHIDLNKKNNAVTNLLVTSGKDVQRLTRELLFDFEFIDRERMTKKKACEYLDYRDGRLFWKKSTGPSIIVGSEAGFMAGDSWRVHFLGNTYTRNQLVYLIHHGFFPDFAIPIDGNKSNSRIENLRGVTASQWATISGRVGNLVREYETEGRAP